MLGNLCSAYFITQGSASDINNQVIILLSVVGNVEKCNGFMAGGNIGGSLYVGYNPTA